MVATLDYMSSQPIRIESETIAKLRRKSLESGESLTRLAQRYIMEGLKMEEHPGIFFRTGPAGRRAVLVGGPDVWEVINGLHGMREVGEARVRAVAECTGIPEKRARVALRYYAAHPEEIDSWIAANDAEAEELERILEREREILG